MKLAVERARCPAGLALVQAFATRGDEVLAAGSLLAEAALLSSTDGGASFTPWPTLQGADARGLLVGDDGVWLVGGHGFVGVTRDRGATWRRVPIGPTLPIHAIARGSDGATWIAGDRGLLLRAPAGGDFARVPHPGGEDVFAIAATDRGVWLMGHETFERSTDDGFVAVPLPGETPSLMAMTRTPTGALVVVGRDAALYRSTDGRTWQPGRLRVDERRDLHAVTVTPYGLVAAGNGVFVSRDDGATFERLGLDRQLTTLYAAHFVRGGLLLGGNMGIYRIRSGELAKLLRGDRDPIVAELARRVEDGDDGAELVLEDALRERGRY